MKHPTPFCRAVIALLKAAPNNFMDSYHLRESLMAQGFGKHPAAVAMHLTKLAWKGEYINTWCDHQNNRHFSLTSEGREFEE